MAFSAIFETFGALFFIPNNKYLANKMNKLELFLITYNRKDKCKKTLETILADNSPLKGLPLTVLDNASTDGSSEVIETFAKKFANVTHIRHPKNIGGNANITRSYEMATAP